MTRITVKQIDHLNRKVQDAFGSFERVLDQQVKMEERKFVDDKKEQIAEKLGADKIKKALKEAEERYEQAQEEAKKFLKTFANKHKLQGTIRDYRYSDTKFKVSDIDEQVDDFAMKYASSYIQKTEAMKQREHLRKLKSKCYDAVALTNDIEQAQAKVETLLKTKAPFILEQYQPDINLLEAPKREEEQL